MRSVLSRLGFRSPHSFLRPTAVARSGVRGVRDTLHFLDILDDVATRVDVNPGQLFQGLLQHIGSYRGSGGGVSREEGTYDAYTKGVLFKLDIDEDERSRLFFGARGVVDLVRIKLEDKNDLETARSALRHANTFFHEVEAYATAHDIDPYDTVGRL